MQPVLVFIVNLSYFKIIIYYFDTKNNKMRLCEIYTHFYRLPFYYEAKIVFVCWLVLPYSKGSTVLYKKFIHPNLSKREQVIKSIY